MGIDPKTQINASVIMERDVYEQIKAFAKKERRSVSAQMCIWLEERMLHERERATTVNNSKFNSR